MPFDPDLPEQNAPIRSDELRNQFNGLKALIDAVLPIGGIIPWAKNSFNVALVLPENFLECNGQVVNDAESPLNGETLPNLNGDGRFLRGAALSGDTGGAETHTHDIAVGSGFDGVNVDNGGSGQSLDANPKTSEPASSLPPFYEVVYVMRVR